MDQRPSHHLVRESSVTSTGSTFAVEASKEEENLASPRGRRLQFDESLNEVYASSIELDEDDIDDLWYSKYDIDEMRHDFAETVRCVRRVNRLSPGSLPHQLQQVYLIFRNATSGDEILRAMEKSNVEIPDEYIGLEKQLLRPCERSVRKHNVIKITTCWPRECALQQSAERLRLACRSQSRPTVYFAYFIAERAAATSH